MYKTLSNLVTRIKDEKPLILNLSNYVTMDFIANGLLSLGASPIMTHSPNEIEDLVSIANGIVINVGTLDEQFITLCKQACQVANQLGKPITFDPVGAGASKYRTQTCMEFMEQFQFTTIRGNASEIMALYSSQLNTKGVDSTLLSIDALESAKQLSLQHQTIIAISGPTDVVVNGNEALLFKRGSPLMPMITGSGCLLTSVISAFMAVSEDHYTATCAAIVFYGACGELAATQAQGPGTFKTHFIDALAQLPARGDYE